VRTRLKSKWYLAPLTALPVEGILRNNYALRESLLPGIPIVIFQGSADSQTPISELSRSLGPESRRLILQVDGGTHSTTFVLSRAAQLSAISRLMRGYTAMGR
jgi:hypothetical protein